MDLNTFRENGENFYDSYLESQDNVKRDIVIMQTSYPDVLHANSSIYSRKHIYDLVWSISKQFYEERGLNVIKTGPSGLGATAGIMNWLGQIVQWAQLHKDILSLVKPLYVLLIFVYKKYQSGVANKSARQLRSKLPKISLSIELYIDESSKVEDLIAYAEQLTISLNELYSRLPSYIDIFLHASVSDVHSTKRISIFFSNLMSDSIVSKVIKKLDSSKIESNRIDLHVKRGVVKKVKIHQHRSSRVYKGTKVKG
jgi:hypothetical protein